MIMISTRPSVRGFARGWDIKPFTEFTPFRYRFPCKCTITMRLPFRHGGFYSVKNLFHLFLQGLDNLYFFFIGSDKLFFTLSFTISYTLHTIYFLQNCQGYLVSPAPVLFGKKSFANIKNEFKCFI